MGINRIRRDIAAELRRGGLKPVRSRRRDGVRVIAGVGDTHDGKIHCVVTAYYYYGDTVEAMGLEARDASWLSTAAELILTAAGYVVRRNDTATFGIVARSRQPAGIESF